MLRNKLTKWNKSLAFRSFEIKYFPEGIKGSFSFKKYSSITQSQQKNFLRISRIGSGSKFSINEGFKGANQIINKRLYSTKLPPHEIILMPALSPTMTTGNIGTFHKKIGEAIQAGDVLCEIETDKAQMDFEVQEEGFLAKILIAEGTKDAQVGQPLAILVTKKEDIDAFKDYSGENDAKESKKDETKPTTSETTKSNSPSESTKTTESIESSSNFSQETEKMIKASPLAKKIASEQGINLNNLKGSGPNGRIIKDDVISVDRSEISKPTAVSGTANFVDLPLSNMRKVIANRLTQSKQEIPHYYLKIDIEMDRILELRSKFNSTPLLQETFGEFKLSVNDFIIKAAGLALKKVPECNSSWHETFIRQHGNVDICVAVATPSGLITPIVSGADQRGLVSISGRVKELASRAKINKLKPDEYQGGTFTISNLGMYGVDSFTAIINPPQSCILAVGATKPIVRPNGSVAQSMTVTLSCDHRVVDGATGAQWLSHFKRFLEEPEQMIL